MSFQSSSSQKARGWRMGKIAFWGTLFLSGVGFVTSALSIQGVMKHELYKELLQFHQSQIEYNLTKIGTQCKTLSYELCIKHLKSTLEEQLQSTSLLKDLFITFPPFKVIDTLPSKEKKEIQDYIRQEHLFIEHLFESKKPLIHFPSEFTLHSTPQLGHLFTLPDGRRVGLVLRLNLYKMNQNVRKKTRLIWLILGLHTLIIACFTLYLSQKVFLNPLKRLVHFVQDHSRLKKKISSPPLSSGIEEFLILQSHFINTLNALHHEHQALIEAHILVKRYEGLTTAGVVASSIVHEIGNPLASVLGLVQFIKKNETSASDEQILLEKIEQELHRIRLTTRHLLDLSKPYQRDRTPIEIGHSLLWASKMLSYQPNGQDIHTEIQGDLTLKVLADEHLLKHVWLNLFMNAAQAQEYQGEIYIELERILPTDTHHHLFDPLNFIYSHFSATPSTIRSFPSTGPSPIVLSASSSALSHSRCPLLLIHILDRGKGIDPTQIDSLFQFLTSPSSSGNGLGLAITAHLLQDNHGAIWYDPHPPKSRDRGGSCFTCVLPLASFE